MTEVMKAPPPIDRNRNNVVHQDKHIQIMIDACDPREMRQRLRLPDAAHATTSDAATATDDEAFYADVSVDPFTHNCVLSWTQWLRSVFLTVFLLPVRLMCAFLLVLIAWVSCRVGLHGLTKEEKEEKPLSKGRKICQSMANCCGRWAFRCCGFCSVTVKGRRLPASEAPILVVAPHSTFFDAFAIFWSGNPYIVSRDENRKIPMIGTCAECAQALFVSREDPDSRQKTVKSIIRRINSGDDWPQLLIFPEGSCSNGQALLTFKPGAFYPGKPVQPVVIRYPNKLDTVRWTWNQPYGALKVLWLTVTQPYTRAEIEYLPVVKPTPQEVDDPKMFARNVRQVMADALGIPTCDMTYDEAKALYGRKSKNRRNKKRRESSRSRSQSKTGSK